MEKTIELCIEEQKRTMSKMEQDLRCEPTTIDCVAIPLVEYVYDRYGMQGIVRLQGCIADFAEVCLYEESIRNNSFNDDFLDGNGLEDIL